MTYYHVRSPASGNWMCAPFKGSSADINKAWPYPEDHPRLHDMVEFALKRGYRMRLRQVMVVEEESIEATCVHGIPGHCDQH